MNIFEGALALGVTLLFILGVKNFIVWYKKEAMEKELEAFSDFSPTHKFMGNDGKKGIAVDEERKKVCLINNETDDINLKTISYCDLLSSEIFVDGETVTRTARGSQIGGALLGGFVAGGVGAVIGGLSGKTVSSEKIKRVDLRITVNDSKKPLHDINFMESILMGKKKDSSDYEEAINQARHWHGLISVLIKDADSEDASENKSALTEDTDISSSKRSITDELSKLGDLRDKGLLTDDEFMAQKQKLLD